MCENLCENSGTYLYIHIIRRQLRLENMKPKQKKKTF